MKRPFWDLPVNDQRCNSEIPSRQWLDRYDTSIYETSVIILGSLVSADLQHLKMVSCPTVGSVMMANGGSSQAFLSADISCYGSLSAIILFYFFISCLEDYMTDEMKWPCICLLLPVRHSPAFPLPFLIPYLYLLPLTISLCQMQWRYEKSVMVILLPFSLLGISPHAHTHTHTGP